MDQPSGLIDASADFPEVERLFHIAYFVPVNWGEQDRVSRSIIDFQHMLDPQTEQWVRLAETLAAPLACDAIVRALGSKEATCSGNSPLDLLCRRIAERISAPFTPERLWKIRRTAPVKNGGGKRNRLKILHQAYEFNGSGLVPDASILLVDDIVTTGATLKAITGAIREEIPNARITVLALARTDPHLVQMHLGETVFEPFEESAASTQVNPHLDDRYFYRSIAPAVAAPRPRSVPPVIKPDLPRPPQRAPEPLPRIEYPPTAPPLEKVFGEEDFTTTTAVPIRLVPAERDTTKPPPAAARPELPKSKERTISPIVYAIGAAAVIFVVFFFLTSNMDEPPPASNLPPVEVETRPVVSQPESPPVPPPKAPRKAPPPLRHGIIVIPVMGLRSGPSLDSTALAVTVLQGERVTILRTESPETGPGWVQIRKEDGTVGWVFAGAIARDTLGTRSQ